MSRRINPWHTFQAQDAFFVALAEAGFHDDLAAFAERNPPQAFDLADAESASPPYEQALTDFVRRWGLAADWFWHECHNRAWRMTRDGPARFYGHPRPPPLGGLIVWFGFSGAEGWQGHPTPPRGPGATPSARAVWPEDTKAEAREWVLGMFEAF